MSLAVASVCAADLPRVREYLRAHAETSLFLLSNLKAHGHVLSGAMNSGNFKFLADGDRIAGVFCLTRRGNLLAEGGGRAELAPAIVAACRDEPMAISGVVGEWRLAKAIWQRLLASGAIVDVVHASREPLYRLELASVAAPGRHRAVRALQPADFAAWEPLNSAYLQEEGLPVQGSLEQRRDDFCGKALAGCWWGLLERGQLIAIGGLNAMHDEIGQIGGVYTIPAQRRRGRATRVMESLIADCRERHGLDTLILFTGEHNQAARRLYESLGFSRTGEFALLFGRPTES